MTPIIKLLVVEISLYASTQNKLWFVTICSPSPNLKYLRIFFTEIQDSVDSLEEWLEEMENTLQPLPLNSRWSKKAINEKMKELKVGVEIIYIYIYIYI